LSGQIELQLLVGPAEVVGLEPAAVGSVPFSVTGNGEPYTVQGATTITYADVLVREWGTYDVTLDVEATIEGQCLGSDGNEELDAVLTIAGDQMVKVEAEGFQGEYPWAGEQSLDASFALVDGATVEGEGFTLVLHLNGE
jgi:hypothetical protein